MYDEHGLNSGAVYNWNTMYTLWRITDLDIE